MLKSFQNQHPKIHETAYVADSTVIIGAVEIGAESSVWFGSILRGDVNHIRIGSRSNVQDGTLIHVSTLKHPAIIEDEVSLGHRATLHGCHIETGCLVGIGSIVLDGVRVGRNSLVAAGSLITPHTQIPPRSLVMGSPAKVKRQLTDAEVVDLERYWKNYVQISRIYRHQKTFDAPERLSQILKF